MIRNKRFIFISNSIPKSGSTFLFNLQRSFLEGVFDKKFDYSELKDFGIEVNGGYIDRSQEERFVDFIRSKPASEESIIVKMHTEIGDRLKEEFLSNEDIYMSFSIRDPAEVFMSARKNFVRSGEFSEFSSIQTGLDVINGWYKEILYNTAELSSNKKVSIVEYGELISDPIRGLLKSLDLLRSRLSDFLSYDMAKKYINMNDVEGLSLHRKSRDEEVRQARVSDNEWQSILNGTSDFRLKINKLNCEQ